MSEPQTALERWREHMRGRVRVFHRGGLMRYLAILGPGIIAAVAGDDAGGIATYASAGAQYGYATLWVIVVITVCLLIVQEMVTRMGAVTGKGLSDLIRERFGVRWTAFAMLTLLVANAATIVSEFAGIAAALELFGVTKYISVPLVGAMLWWLVTKGSYRRVERVFLLMTTAFLAYIISAFLARPDWGQVARNTVIPSITPDSAYLVLIMALIGTTITPYMQIFQQSAIVDKGVTVQDYDAARADMITGVLLSDIIAYFIIIATAATLYVNGIQIQTAADAALALEPLAGRFSTVLFAIGLLGASILAAGVLPLATSFSVCEAFGWQSGLDEDFTHARIFYGLFTGLLILGGLVTLIPGLPLFQLLVLVQVVNGVLLPIELLFIMRLVNDRDIMGDYVNGRLFNIGAWATTISIGALSVSLLVISFILPLFGINLGGG
ncbi:MAG: Nramp family divalent metal transporter [Anaerolineae bacterium]